MNQGMAGQYRRTAIAGAVAVCAMTSGQGWAQEQAGAAPAPGLLYAQTVVVTGVRAALEQSLRQSMVMSPDGALIFLERPIAVVLLALAVVALALVAFKGRTSKLVGETT